MIAKEITNRKVCEVMNKYDKIIIKILLKICKMLSENSSVKNIDTMIYTIEQEFKEKEN